jgi:hypothetical protein
MVVRLMGYLAVLFLTFVAGLLLNAMGLGLISFHMSGTVPSWILVASLILAFAESHLAGRLYEEVYHSARD